jgi:hypothetical protein
MHYHIKAIIRMIDDMQRDIEVQYNNAVLDEYRTLTAGKLNVLDDLESKILDYSVENRGR